MDYILEIKQIVDYPRVRIHRELIQKLMTDTRLSIRGSCHLFQFLILCSFANFRTSRKSIDGKKHLVGPGEWICSMAELAEWFRLDRPYKAVRILDKLKDLGLISYQYLAGTKVIKYKIGKWGDFNTVLEYEYECCKDTGFFFFPIAYADKLMGGAACSELDIVMDLWLNTIYNDTRVKGSDLGPVVYYRNMTGDPTTSYRLLSERWGKSKATVGRVLAKLEALEYLTCLTFSGNQGTILYLNTYLSTMFNISDVPVDKQEVSFALKMQIRVEGDPAAQEQAEVVAADSVSNSDHRVSKPIPRILVDKVLEMLSIQGFSCAACSDVAPKLYSLSVACGRLNLDLTCTRRSRLESSWRGYRFQLKVMDGG